MRTSAFLWRHAGASSAGREALIANTPIPGPSWDLEGEPTMRGCRPWLPARMWLVTTDWTKCRRWEKANQPWAQ